MPPRMPHVVDLEGREPLLLLQTVQIAFRENLTKANQLRC